MNPADYSALDETLEVMAPMGPDLRNGFSNHAPMAIEAMCAMRRGDAVMPWFESYRHSLIPRRARVARLTNDNWRAALGDHRRTEDWFEFFRNELEERPWPEVLDSWAARLAPGFPSGDASAFLSDLTATFARVFLANAHDIYTTIAFVHAVTGPSALRPLVPYLRDKTLRDALAYAWQTAAAMYATFGTNADLSQFSETRTESKDELFDRAIACGDEHAIKFTEVCLREHALKPDPAFLAAASHAIRILSAT
jgi:hypothetical protein